MMLSPQIGVQVHVGLQGHDHPGIGPDPSARQPRPSFGVPSSQTSDPTAFPSLGVGTQAVGESPLHVQFGSVAQVASHPSPAVVPPSSHVSGLLINPSPQIIVHVKAPGLVPVHVYPAAAPTHPTAHPTPSFDPSSHVSGVFVVPEPQTGTQVVGSAPLQENPVSTVQVALQPSPATAPPSSQTSGLIILPSPHSVVHTEADVGLPGVQLQPGRAAAQVESHPTALFDPSSQDSVPVTLPSPHTAPQTVGVNIEFG